MMATVYSDGERRFSPIVELRRYRLHRGRRDALIALFDAHFVESQEACCMKIIGQFRDLDDPDAFVWLRGFDDMEKRHAALAAFYGGPVWAEHRNAANATMIDSDDVLLLHPAGATSGFVLSDTRNGHSTPAESKAMIQAVTYRLKRPAEPDFISFYREVVQGALHAAGDRSIAQFTTEHSANTFTPLPVRTGENVFVCFSRFEDEAAHAAFDDRLVESPVWQAAFKALSSYLMAPPVVARLAPTARSLLR